ncbi:MAG: SDR family NAD(P)-dependent oxidoreductase [Nannocystaceae bacterium]
MTDDDRGDELGRLWAAIADDPALARPRAIDPAAIDSAAILGEGRLDLGGLRAGARTRALRGLPAGIELRGLYLEGAVVDAATIDALAGAIARAPALRHLSLRGADLDPAGLRALAPALTGIRALDLGGLPLAGEALSVLCDMVDGTCPKGLVALSLRGAALDPAGLARLAGALGRGALVRLDLRGIAVDEAALEALLAGLAAAPALARLDVDDHAHPALRQRRLARLAHRANHRTGAAASTFPERQVLWDRIEGTGSKDQARHLLSLPLPAGVDADDLEAARRVLRALGRRRALLRDPHPLVAGLREDLLRLVRDDRAEARRGVRRRRVEAARARAEAEDRRAIEATGIRRRRRGEDQGPPPPERPAVGEGPEAPPAPDPEAGPILHRPRACYVCKRSYRELHAFYDHLCPGCAEYNFARRHDAIDLRGKVVLLTGGRVKVGHEVALRLLRWGAQVIVTTRFPHDAARRFALQPDFEDYADRVHVYPLDLRDIPAVERFAAHVARAYPRLDALINNAAQTVYRPPGYYAHLFEFEALAGDALPSPLRPLLPPLPDLRGARVLPAAPADAESRAAILAAAAALFPPGSDDGFGGPLDLRPTNSWRLRLDEVSAVELVEVQLVNQSAPFLLCARLRGILSRKPATGETLRPADAAFIVNVSAPEGQFYRGYKAPYHPHTNMAKAALNMMTRTSGEDYARDGIFMTSVDTGWISNDNPHEIAEAMRERGFAPPIDAVDAAARVCDPIVRGVRDGELVFGVFLKDYRAVHW